MHVGTILWQDVCRVVSSSTINRLFLSRARKWFVLWASLSLFVLTRIVHWQFLLRLLYWYNCTIDGYRHTRTCLSSEVEMIIINDHGSLVVCCWQYLFFSNMYLCIQIDGYIYIQILQWEKEKSGITKLDVVNSRLGLLVESFGRKKGELIDID